MADENNVKLSKTLGEINIDFGNICRFCLTETQDDISINDKCSSGELNGLESSVFNFIKNLRIIEVKNFENFPTQICENCFELINLFYNFSQLCQKSDSLLRNCYENTLREIKMKLSVKDNEITEFEIPLKDINIPGDEVPEVVHCVVKVPKHSKPDQKLKDSINAFETYKEKFNSLLQKIKNAQLKLTSNELVKNKNKNFYACSQCSLQFTNSKALKFHCAATHSQNRFKNNFKFQCKNCIKMFSDCNKLKRHYRIRHGIPESNLPETYLSNRVKQLVKVQKINFFCFHCVPYKQFQAQKQLIDHLEDCHNVKQVMDNSATTSLVIQKPPLNQKSPKVLICVNPTPSLSKPEQKSENLMGMSVLLNALDSVVDSLKQQQQEKHSGFKVMCKNCDPVQEFTSANDFVNHVHSNHNEEKALENWTMESKTKAKDDRDFWNCPECPASYSRKQSLNCHMREKHKHLNPRAMKCPEPECTESFPTNRRLIQHGISVHQKYFAYFHHVFKKVLHPEDEEFRESREKNFECDICQRKYIYKTSLRKHILTAHLGKSAKDTVVCPYCGKTLSNKINLKSHIEFVHEALFVSCPICKKKINFKTLGRHYKTHRANTEDIFSENYFLCNLCGKVLKSKRSFEDHQKIHKNIRDEICDICGSGFTTKKLLRLHKKTHDGIQRKMFSCNQCEKVFSGRHTLNRHLLTHSGKKNFICEICSKCFYTNQELNRHVRFHKKDYKFDCQLCDMKFLYKSRFRHHMMKHRNIRPHKCQFCDKMFIERAKMNLHMASKHNVEVQNTKAIWKDPKTYVPLDDLL